MVLYVDVVDVCNLKCPTCVRGTGLLPNSAKAMPLDKFERISVKARREGFTMVGLFNWTEPFLAPNLQKYIAIVKELGMQTGISSNLSLRRIDNLEAVLMRTDILQVSVSGFDQEVYEINHVGGRVDYIVSNLGKISELKKSGRIHTLVNIKFIQFDYNTGELEKLRDLAERLGLGFEVIQGHGHPQRWTIGRADEKLRQQLASYSAARPHEKPGEVCPLLFEHVVVDCAGDIFECCAFGNYDFMKIGQYLDLSPEEILLRRYQHPICNSCNWPRRAATEEEKHLLARSMLNRLSASGSASAPPADDFVIIGRT